MEVYGADIIRLWALSVDFTEDHRIGDEILKGVSDQYRKLRNTFRYLLGALEGFTEAERVDDVAAMPELERYMLALLAKLDATLRAAVDSYDFNTYVRALTDFCNEDLSAFFFDVRKDCLYCDAATDPKRMVYRTVLDTLFHALVRYAAPVLVFTSEEVWGTRYPEGGSVHLLEWPKVEAAWANPRLEHEWERMRLYRSEINEAIEPLRRDKTVGSSLEANVSISFPMCADLENRAPLDLAELFIVSSISTSRVSGKDLSSSEVPDMVYDHPQGAHISVDRNRGIVVTRTTHHKCGRCWRHLPEVAEDGALCSRCDQVVSGMDASA
jgi:isoleucyl-tRNA synthetase